MLLLDNLLLSLFATLLVLLVYAPVIFTVLLIVNIKKHNKLKNKLTDSLEDDGDTIRKLKKKTAHIILSAVFIAISLVPYVYYMFTIGYEFFLVLLFLLPFMALYAIPWFLIMFAVISLIQFVTYKGKAGETEEQIAKKRKIKKIIFIVSSVVAITVFALYSTVIFKALSEISFM